MKTRFIKIFLMVIFYAIGLCQGSNLYAQDCHLKIMINNIKKPGAPILIKIWTNANYMKGKPFKELTVRTGIENYIIFDLNDLNAGEYGISLFQDVNKNGKLDKSLIGKPLEPIGFSNNAAATFGPPKYNEVKFTFKGNKTLTIDLK
jgi:uncharacterized protein (DUF2141 family)